MPHLEIISVITILYYSKAKIETASYMVVHILISPLHNSKVQSVIRLKLDSFSWAGNGKNGSKAFESSETERP